MKNVLFSLAALLTFGLTNAQVKEKGVIEITPKIGTSNFTEFNEDDSNSTNYNSGVEIGATIDYYFNDRWSLRSGLIANKMGGKYDFNNNSYEDKLNYLTIPINANWHFGSTRKWNLNFGLSPSFLTSAKVSENRYTANIPKNTIESFQLGFSFGIGYKIGITEKFGILIDAQWFNGLTNINKSIENNRKITNSGYSFNLGGVIQL